MDGKAIDLEGGLGDILIGYWRKPLLRRLPAMKRIHPDWRLRLIVTSHNPAARDVFKYVPYIDELLWVPWSETPDQRREKFRHFAEPYEILEDTDEYRQERPVLYLSPKEEELVQLIADKGRYVVCHLYAGKPELNFDHKVDLQKLMDLIITNDYNVVIVGGTFPRYFGKEVWPVTEQFTPTHHRIFQVTHLNNVRVCAKLVTQAAKVIGTDSAYCCTASQNNVPFMVICPDGLNWDESPDGARTIMKAAGGKIQTWSTVDSQDKLADVINGWLR